MLYHALSSYSDYEKMASCWTDCVIQRAIDEAALSLGYDSVREIQTKTISSVVAGKDVFLSLFTSTGKSLCFALVPLVFYRLFGYQQGTKTSRRIPSYCSSERSGKSFC